MQTDRAKRFYGIIDNQGVWSMLCRAHKMRDLELLRSIPGNVYLRDIRRMTREFPDRVQWIWVKSHTYRTGPIYRAHDKCDRECGRIAEEGEDEVQEMFVKRDWQFIMVDETGQRIEGDVRAQVRIRMNEYRRENQKARGGSTWSNIENMTTGQRKAAEVVFAGKTSKDQWRKKELLQAIRWKWGLKGEYTQKAELCRLCCQHELEEEETIDHVTLGLCSDNLVQLRIDNEKALEREVSDILSPCTRDQLRWTAQGSLIGHLPLVLQTHNREMRGDKDRWVHEYQDSEDKWRKWEEEPFTKAGANGLELDMEMLVKANTGPASATTYPKYPRRIETSRMLQYEHKRVSTSRSGEALMSKMDVLMREAGVYDLRDRSAGILQIGRTYATRCSPMHETLSAILSEMEMDCTHQGLTLSTSTYSDEKRKDGRLWY